MEKWVCDTKSKLYNHKIKQTYEPSTNNFVATQLHPKHPRTVLHPRFNSGLARVTATIKQPHGSVGATGSNQTLSLVTEARYRIPVHAQQQPVIVNVQVGLYRSVVFIGRAGKRRIETGNRAIGPRRQVERPQFAFCIPQTDSSGVARRYNWLGALLPDK